MTRVFKTRHFQRWMRKTELTDAVLCRAVQEVAAGLIEHSRTRRQPEVVTIDEAGRIFAAAPKQSYRVFFLTRYSLGLLLRYSLGLLFGQFQAKSSLILGPDDGVWRSALLRAPSSHFVTHGQEARKMNGDRER